MMKFKKGYSIKIISATLILAFLLTNNAYSNARYCLRKPLDFNHQNEKVVRYE
jgi:hypothetical protein